MPVWLVTLVVGVALSFLAAALAPRARTPKPSALQSPTASAGAPIPKVFGTKTVSNTNTLWYGDISVTQRTTKA